ncbi:outer membrane protein [Haliscomenobacter hydrossis]|uniref:outer membrane protein n=1 Tax=Haliscomenobacter hydrossis TaxID=2350 RepID=UPI0011D2615B|nr:porin family protein [Haliscomenobacter hydrossis]
MARTPGVGCADRVLSHAASWFSFRAHLLHPIGESKLHYLLEGGGIANHIEIENKEGDIINDSGHGLGWQVGAGLGVSLSDRFRITPSIRYRTLSRDFDITKVKTEVDLNYLSVGLGFNWLF